MSALRALLARSIASLRTLAGSPRADAEMRDELESHLAMHVEENLRRGMTPETARRDALLAAGGLTLAAESVRERHGLAPVENVVTDLRYAARALRSKRGFTAAVVLTLGLGIGANTAMFTIVNAVVLRPLPYPRPDRIVSLSVSYKGVDAEVVDDRDYFAWSGAATSLTMAAVGGMTGVVTTGFGPEEIRGTAVTAPYFDVFGVRPLIGRTFTAEDERPNRPRVIVLSEQLWRRGFGAERSIVGRAVTLDGKLVTVVGVLPASFTSPRRAQFWLPYHLEPATGGSTFYYQTVARLRDGVSLSAARAELATITRRIDAQRPATERGLGPVVMTLHERRYGDRRRPLLLLFAAVGVLLLIACANLANLALARAASRHREFAVRLALGAGRWRLVRYMLCESVLLALGGAALGLALSMASVGYVVRLSPASVGNAEGIRIDSTVLLFTLGVAVAAGVIFGLIPAFAAARGDLHRALSAGGPRAGGSPRQQLARRVLVVGQLATALVLLTAAGLVARTFWRVASIDPGFRPERLVAATVRLPEPRYSDRTAGPYFEELLERVRHLPGVESAALADTPPLAGVRMSVTTKDSAGRETPRMDVVAVGPDYFRTIGATIVAGRPINPTDAEASPRVVVVNATLARQLFPGTTAVGKTMAFRGGATIVGVASDVLQRELEHAEPRVVYMPVTQDGMSTYMRVMVRASGPPGSVEAAVTQIARSIDPALPPPAFTTMDQALAEAVAPRKFTFVLLGIFAALAASLAVIGLYGVLAHLVAARTREIGIRVALGADSRRVTRLVLGQGMALAIMGVGVGVAASLATVRTVRTLVYDMSVYDPWTFAAGATLLVVVSAVASYVPARRASRVDPMVALRAE